MPCKTLAWTRSSLRQTKPSSCQLWRHLEFRVQGFRVKGLGVSCRWDLTRKSANQRLTRLAVHLSGALEGSNPRAQWCCSKPRHLDNAPNLSHTFRHYTQCGQNIIHVYIYSIIQYNAITSTLQYNTVQYSTIHTIPYNTIPYHAIQHNTIWQK